MPAAAPPLRRAARATARLAGWRSFVAGTHVCVRVYLCGAPSSITPGDVAAVVVSLALGSGARSHGGAGWGPAAPFLRPRAAARLLAGGLRCWLGAGRSIFFGRGRWRGCWRAGGGASADGRGQGDDGPGLGACPSPRPALLGRSRRSSGGGRQMPWAQVGGRPLHFCRRGWRHRCWRAGGWGEGGCGGWMGAWLLHFCPIGGGAALHRRVGGGKRALGGGDGQGGADTRLAWSSGCIRAVQAWVNAGVFASSGDFSPHSNVES